MLKKVIATHSGGYHSDDLFAVASLQLLLGIENVKIVRTRDSAEIEKADYVVDVGGVLDPDRDRFDHHQSGGAGSRENGIPYASFGLVWKKYGEKIAGGSKEALYIDQKLIQPIDAVDSGHDIYSLGKEKVMPYLIQTLLSSFAPTWKEDINPDDVFMDMLPLARKILKREIELASQFVEAETQILDVYKKSKDRKILVFGKDQLFGMEVISNVLSKFREPLFVILYKPREELWQTLAIKKELGSFELKVRLPEEWGGVFSADKLQELTGMKDVVFVHIDGFMALSKSKETAIALANKALET